MMKKGSDKVRDRKSGDLRTRYRPPRRIGRSLTGMAPWLDIVLIFIFFLIVEARYVLQPGVVINLPEAPFRDGVSSGPVAVAVAVEDASGKGMNEMVFFEDQAFRLDDESGMADLRNMFENRARKSNSESFILQADERVSHGSVLRLLSMARETGFRSVNLAAKP